MKGTKNGNIWAKYGCYPLRPCNFQNWPLRPLSATLCPNLQKLKLLCRNSINYAKPNICGWALMPKSMPSRLEQGLLKIWTEQYNCKKWNRKGGVEQRYPIYTTKVDGMDCVILSLKPSHQHLYIEGSNIFLSLLKVNKSRKHFFLKLHCPQNERNIWQKSALAS